MKNKLKHRLQIRFVLFSATALIILLAVITGFSTHKNYQDMTVKADRIIKLISSEPDSPEIPEAGYFSVKYDLENKKLEADLSHTSLVTKAQAADYARQIIDTKSDKGYLDGFRYLVRREKNCIRITFLSRSAALDAFYSNSKTLLIISAAGVVIMTLLLAAVSGKITAPVVKNRQKQKEFITSASHELKTPLAVIYADAQLLESEIGENEWLSDILKQTKYMTEMTQRLVYLARAEEQENHFIKIDFPISDMAEEITDTYRSVAQNSGKAYNVNITGNLTYCGDEKAIRELMNALLDNAFKYSTTDGQITVSLTPAGHGVCFCVKNTVAQMNPSQLPHLTSRFYRNDTSDKIKGFGIGLSMAQVIAGAHKGSLKIELIQSDCIKISAFLK